MDSTSSYGLRSTVRYLRKNSETGTFRRLTSLGLPPPASPPTKEDRTNLAPSAASMGFISLMGLAVTRLPPRQATLRICEEANHRSMFLIGPAMRLIATEEEESASTRSQTCWRVLRGAQAPTWMDSDVKDTPYRVPMECEG